MERVRIPVLCYTSGSSQLLMRVSHTKLFLLLLGNEEWIFHLCQSQKLVPLTGWVHSSDTECHYVLCLWGDQYGRPLALGSRGSGPIEAFQWDCFPKTQERRLAPKNFHHWELLYLPPWRPILHPGGRFNLFRTEVLQRYCPRDSMVGSPKPHWTSPPHTG
jgi:hypothetical protein